MAHPEALDPPRHPTPSDLDRLDIVKDLTDQLIDLMLNLRQSGHPGGSRSKVPLMVEPPLGGEMRWDIRRPGRRFADRFVLCAGHCAPLRLRGARSALNEALRRGARAHRATPPTRSIRGPHGTSWEDLLGLRRLGGLPGHVEMSARRTF